MDWFCEPYWTAPFPLMVMGLVVFFVLGVKVGITSTFFSAFDWEQKYKQWKIGKGYEDAQ